MALSKMVQILTHVEDMHLACCFDKEMLVGVEVLIVSIAEHSKTRRPIFFHAFTDKEIFPRLKEIFSSLDMAHLNLRLSEIPTSSEVAQKINAKDVVLGSLHLPKILSDVHRLLILDADTLVLCPLDPLFDTPLQDKVLAAATDYTLQHFLAYNDFSLRHQQITQSAKEYFDNIAEKIPSGRYLNSGILLIDPSKWASENMTERCLAYLLQRSPCAFNDQDALNNVLLGRYADLDPRWNSIAFVCRDGSEQEAPSRLYQNIRKSWRTDPWIVHYAGPCKPWRPNQFMSDHRGVFFDMASRNALTAVHAANEPIQTVRKSWVSRLREMLSH